jgi:hypothetical protein
MMYNGGACSMVILKFAVAVCICVPETCTVKFETPCAVGVPEIKPPVLRDKPGGRVQDFRLHR